MSGMLQAIFDKNQSADNMHMGDVLSLFDVARNKVIGMATLAIYYRQAKDNELKDLIKNAVDMTTGNHIKKIQKLLKSSGFAFPYEPDMEKKFDESLSFNIPSTIIDDEEIAISLREIVRLTLSLESEALRNSTDEETRKLMKEIYTDDNLGLSAVLALQRKKKWEDFPPAVIAH